jgi:hypothetical protein
MFFLFVAGSMHSSTHKTYNVLVDVYIVLCNSQKKTTNILGTVIP